MATMKNSIYVLTCLSSLLCQADHLFAKEKEAKGDKPNVIFILSDDQKWNTIGALGNPHVKTPNIDKIVERSMVFNNAYCFGGNSAAVSIPSRNMIMTGRNWFDFEQDVKQEKEKNPDYKRPLYFGNPDWDNMPKAFKKGGYETFYREKSGIANLHQIRSHFDYYEDINMVEQLRTGRAARTIVDDAIEYLQKDRDPNKPFMMYLGLPCPHDPRWALQEFNDLYQRDQIPLPESFQAKHEWNIGSMVVRDESLEQFPRTEESIKRHLHDYYALVSAMDYDLGRLFAMLEKEGLFDNTIIIYSSDQGIAIGDHGLMGKQNIYEGTLKVPMFIVGPGISKGKSDAFVYLHDVLPTLCDLVDIEAPQGISGISFKENIYNGETEGKRDRVLLAYNAPAEKRNQRSIRIGDWKLMWFPEIDKFSLYDLKNDPNELQNLAYEPNYKAKVSSMFNELKGELSQLGDPKELKINPKIDPVFSLPTIPKDTTGGVAPGPNLAEPPVRNTSSFPYFID